MSSPSSSYRYNLCKETTGDFEAMHLKNWIRRQQSSMHVLHTVSKGRRRSLWFVRKISRIIFYCKIKTSGGFGRGTQITRTSACKDAGNNSIEVSAVKAK